MATEVQPAGGDPALPALTVALRSAVPPTPGGAGSRLVAGPRPQPVRADARPLVGGVPVLPPPLPGSELPFPIRRLDPMTASNRMLVMWSWATALGLIGLAAALRGLFAILAGTAPGWYEPTLAAVGLGTIGCTTAAFLVVRRPRLPWMLLCLATVPLLVNIGLTITALS